MADIHSNLEALNKVLENKNVEGYIIAGDILGYGPNPNEVTEVILSLKNLILVAGNHDHAAIGLKELEWFNEYAKEAIKWQMDVIEPEYRKFYSTLKTSYRNNLFEVYHGSPQMPVDEYMLEEEQFLNNLNYIKTNIVFIGHSHIPFYAEIDRFHNIKLRYLNDKEVIQIEPSKKYFINPGSVGQPRDNDPRASYGVFDTEKMEFELNRVEYDVETVYKKIKQSKLPDFLGTRLFMGI